MKCPQCGFDGVGNFCNNCGKPLNDKTHLPVVSQQIDKTKVWHVTLSFGKSTSQNFSKALAMAKAAPQYLESTDDQGNPIYQAIYGPKEYLKFIALYELVGSWKSSFVFINGEMIDRKIIGDINYCYGDKLRSGKSDFCFGASEFTKNPFGCHRAQMHSYNDPWYSFGIIDTTGKFHVDKDRIRNELIQRLKPFRFCPSLDMERAIRTVDQLPGVIDPNQDEDWEHATYLDKKNSATFQAVKPKGHGLVSSITYEIKISPEEVVASKETNKPFKEEVKPDNWSTCPRCNSNRVQKISKWALSLTLFGGTGCLIWVGLLFPPLLLGIPVLLILAILMLFSKDAWQCQDCKHSWVVKKTGK